MHMLFQVLCNPSIGTVAGNASIIAVKIQSPCDGDRTASQTNVGVFKLWHASEHHGVRYSCLIPEDRCTPLEILTFLNLDAEGVNRYLL